MDLTREEIKNLLKEAIEPLERKIDNLNNGFQELKRLVDFVNEKYDDILVQLKQANEKIQRQGTSLKQILKDLDDAMNYFIYTSHLFTPHGRYELNKLASLPMCGFIAQLVEHRTGIAEVTGSNSVEALIFSGFLFPKLENLLR